MTPQYVPPTYPVLTFIATSGMKVAVILGLVIGFCGIGMAYVTQLLFIAPVTIIGAILLAGLLASYVELVRIIVDTLVPR